jgi:anti-anti-sigma factor
MMLSYKKQTEGYSLFLSLEGDIDIEATETFQEELFSLVDKDFVNYEISLKEVGFVDSTGIGFIMQLIEKIKEHGFSVGVKDIQADVYEVFQMLQIDEIVGKEVFLGTEVV